VKSVIESHVTEFGVSGEKMVSYAKNICAWYDGTLRPMKGHIAKCQWHFDGQIWWHL
jgi:hypothetical protein